MVPRAQVPGGGCVVVGVVCVWRGGGGGAGGFRGRRHFGIWEKSKGVTLDLHSE